jgi:glycine cleavage system regulatory protein
MLEYVPTLVERIMLVCENGCTLVQLRKANLFALFAVLTPMKLMDATAARTIWRTIIERYMTMLVADTTITDEERRIYLLYLAMTIRTYGQPQLSNNVVQAVIDMTCEWVDVHLQTAAVGARQASVESDDSGIEQEE